MKSLISHLANAYSLKATDIGLPNTSDNIGDSMTRIVGILVYLIGGLSIIFIIVGGIQMVVSSGSPNRVAQGRETIIYAAVGLVIAIGSYAIVTFIGRSL
jgi:hypothetical protein